LAPGDVWEDRCPAKPSDNLPELPKIAVLEVTDSTAGRKDVVVFCPNRNRYICIRQPQWTFLRCLDGQRTIAELEQDFKGRLPDGMVRPLLGRFAELGLIEGSIQDDKKWKNRRLRVIHAGAVQLSIVNPDRLLDQLVPLIRMLAGPTGRTLSALVIVAGLYSMAVHADLVLLIPERLADPVWLITLAAALLLCGMLHELGHAAAVKYFGGRVRRMGLMLFYLAPAMFTDTSDAWRFPRNRQRIVVAAAGIWVQMVVAGLAQIGLWLPVRADVAIWLSSFALLNIVLCVVNLIPFVQLDGYWILVALTGVPNLRSHALDYLKARLLRLPKGVTGPQTPPPRHPVLTILFALGCVLFTPLLIVIVLLTFQRPLLGLGRIGAVAWFLLAASVVAVARNALVRLVRSARDWSRPARLRAGLVGAAAVFVIAGAVVVIQIPLTVQGRFEVSDAGEIIAVFPVQARRHLTTGDHAQLRGLSLADRTFFADGVLARHLQSSGQELRYVVVLDRAKTLKVAPSTAGSLSVRAGDVAAPTWVWNVFLQPALSTLTST
jgi:putative peptide zinc metalloprotease protein